MFWNKKNNKKEVNKINPINFKKSDCESLNIIRKCDAEMTQLYGLSLKDIVKEYFSNYDLLYDAVPANNRTGHYYGYELERALDILICFDSTFSYEELGRTLDKYKNSQNRIRELREIIKSENEILGLK